MFSKRKPLVSFLLAMLALNLLSCAAQGNQLDATSWALESYGASTGEMADVLPDSTVTLYFQAGNANGSAGCNNYTAGYQADSKSLSFGPAAATRKFCVEPLGIMEQEDAFFAQLGNVARYKTNSDTLILMDRQGNTIMTLLRTTAQ